jgi:hypothetical protein
MTFEERLDRLAERHEALAQTVELVAHAQDRNEQEIERLLVMQRSNEEAHARAQAKNAEAQARNAEAQAKNETLMAQMIESFGLARIAQAHENRISGLEAI